MPCNICGTIEVDETIWLCDSCRQIRDGKPLEEHLAKDLCQVCGHHIYDHQAYNKDGNCCACTCSNFKPIFGRVI